MSTSKFIKNQVDKDFVPAPIVLTIEQLIDRMNYFKPYVENIFSFLNENISPLNRCELYIITYHPYFYGDFRKPNRINLALGSIINNFIDGDEDTIKGIIAITLAHELYHASQDTSMIKYGVDTRYTTLIEDQAQYMAEQFLINNRDIMIHRFGFDPIEVFDVENFTHKPYKDYKTFSVKDYYARILAEVIYRNLEAEDQLLSIFNKDTPERKTIILSFVNDGQYNDASQILIKVDGDFTESSIPYFNNIINTFYRRGNATMNYDITTSIYEVDSTVTVDNGKPYKDRITLIELNISNRLFSPIVMM